MNEHFMSVDFSRLQLKGLWKPQYALQVTAHFTPEADRLLRLHRYNQQIIYTTIPEGGVKDPFFPAGTRIPWLFYPFYLMWFACFALYVRLVHSIIRVRHLKRGVVFREKDAVKLFEIEQEMRSVCAELSARLILLSNPSVNNRINYPQE